MWRAVALLPSGSWQRSSGVRGLGQRDTLGASPLQPLPPKAPEMGEADHVLTRQMLSITRGWDPPEEWWDSHHNLVGIFLVEICAQVSPSICDVSLHPARHCRLSQLLSRAVCLTMAQLDNAVWGLSQFILPPGSLELLWSCFPKFLCGHET